MSSQSPGTRRGPFQRGGNERTRSLCEQEDFRIKLLFSILIFVAGFLYSFLRQETLPEVKFPDEDVLIQGTIIDVPEMSEGKFYLTLDMVAIEEKRIQGKVRLVLIQDRFDHTVTENVLAAGCRVSGIATLKEPHVYRNPGVFVHDIRQEGVVAVGYIKQLYTVSRKNGLLAVIHKNRQRLGRIIDDSLAVDNASFHKAIIPGLKRDISQDMRDAFGSTGLAHLLSISGTHFGLLAFLIFKIMRGTLKYVPGRYLTRMTLFVTPTRMAVFATLPVLVLYAFISGLSMPTIRSLIMIIIYMAALFLGRKDQWLNSLSIAAAVILLWQPEALFELSFLLSFLAVLSIGYVLEQRQERESGSTEPGPQNPDYRKGVIPYMMDRIKTGIRITVAAVLGTTPVVMLVFKQFPFIAPITNLIVTPLVCFVILPLGFVTSVLALTLNLSIMPLHGITDALTWCVLKLVEIFSHVPFANFRVHNASVMMVILYYLSLIFLIKSTWKWKGIPLVMIISIYLLGPYLSRSDFKVTFLDIGQGESSLVELPDKTVMLIDGGTKEPDMGRRVIAPFLWSKGIRRIDYMVLSHPHPDHFGGLLYLMGHFDVRNIWWNGRAVAEADEFFHRVKEKKVPVRILKRGDLFEGGKYNVYVLHPYDDFYADSPRGAFSDQNSDSLVLKVASNDTSVLFTGDIEEEAEDNLAHLGKWLRSDIIKVPHHGGRTSSSLPFIEAVNPRIAVINSGAVNPFGHPHRETLDRYYGAGAEVFRTDMDGAVTITIHDERCDAKTYRDSQLKRVEDREDEINNVKLLF